MPDALPLLLIEDDATTRELLSLLLSSAGWDVTTACDGQAALAALNSGTHPAAILCDLQMPGLCGPPLARAMRSIATEPVLLAMTATPLPATPEGFDALLVKPFKTGAIREQYDVVRNASAAVTQAGDSTPASPAVLDRETLGRLRSSMPAPRLMALLAFALDDANTRISRMDRAARAGDDAVFRTEAHALKGGCGMIGALQLQQLAAQAEDEGITKVTLTEWKPLAEFVAASAAIRLMLDTLSLGDTRPAGHDQ
jgi:CheY-like chemotaxis protein